MSLNKKLGTGSLLKLIGRCKKPMTSIDRTTPPMAALETEKFMLIGDKNVVKTIE